MEDQKWLRLVTVGLVLAAVAVGYFLFTSRFSSNKSNKAVLGTVPSATASATPSVAPSIKPVVAIKPTPSPTSAYNKIVERTTKGGQSAETLPRTGFPIVSTVILLSSIMISGWGLRRFPH